jgi:hypothetical protein
MKLSGWTWLVVGFCLSIIILSYGYFYYQVPNNEEAASIKENAQEYADQTTPQIKKNAIKRVTDAQAIVDQESTEWQAIVDRKTPPSNVAEGGIDLSQNLYQLTLDTPIFANNVQRAVNAQLRHANVKVLQGPSVPFPPTEPDTIKESYFNYPAYPFPVCVFKFGTVTVEGTYDQVMENVRGWADMPNYLAVTQGVALNGTSPHITATYDLTVVALIRGHKMAQDISSNIAGVSGAGAPGGGKSTGLAGKRPGGPPAPTRGGPTGGPSSNGGD